MRKPGQKASLVVADPLPKPVDVHNGSIVLCHREIIVYGGLSGDSPRIAVGERIRIEITYRREVWLPVAP